LWGDAVGGPARPELNGGGLGLGREPGPDLGGRDNAISRWSLQSHKNISPNETRGIGTMGMILLGIGCGRRGVVVVSRRRPTVSSHAIEELEDLTEALEIQEVIGPRQGIILGRREIIGAAQGDGGRSPVGEPDDEIRIVSATEADDLDPLAAEPMMRMGDGDESRRRLG
jgi:hypothetical protein